jgi:Zinc finger, C2H2 type
MCQVSTPSSFHHVLILECDKSFTRSDALAKHMRTVHEIEVGKPQEPVFKTQSAQDHKNKRRRSPSLTENGQDDDFDVRSETDDSELALYSLPNRYRFLKRKMRWATERNNSLRQELEIVEKDLLRNWGAKETLLDQVFEKEGIHLKMAPVENA